MPQCAGITKAGARCTFNAREGQTACAKHAAQGQEINQDPEHQLCLEVKGNGLPCNKQTEDGHTACPYHRRVIHKRDERGGVATSIEKDKAHEIAFAEVEHLHTRDEDNILPGAERAMRGWVERHVRGDMAQVIAYWACRYLVRWVGPPVPGEMVDDMWDRLYATVLERVQAPPPPAPVARQRELARERDARLDRVARAVGALHADAHGGVRLALVGAMQAPPRAGPAHTRGGLGAFARDGQNVHTAVVTNQTNAGLEKLLAIPITEGGRSIEALAVIWLEAGYCTMGTFMEVMSDVMPWYNQPTCRATGDRLYMRVLDGLLALIRSNEDRETRAELYKRLYEECKDSKGMCCDGHINRLVNVMAGFDVTFKPSVSLGEALQSSMAEIAGTDISTEEKIARANVVFLELAVPQELRGAWLEAF